MKDITLVINENLVFNIRQKIKNKELPHDIVSWAKEEGFGVFEIQSAFEVVLNIDIGQSKIVRVHGTEDDNVDDYNRYFINIIKENCL